MSGQLKVAPEHVSPRVLHYLGKPEVEVYDEFVKRYRQVNQALGLKQYLVPYFMSSHPGCTLDDAIELAVYMKRTGQHPDQVQDFYPTPGTLSTAMFFTGLDPRDMTPVYVPRDPEEKAMQRALMHYFKPYNRPLVLKALKKAGREDLIGWGRDCLISPRVLASGGPRVSTGATKRAGSQSGSAGRSEPPREIAPKEKGTGPRQGGAPKPRGRAEPPGKARHPNDKRPDRPGGKRYDGKSTKHRTTKGRHGS